MTAIPAALIDRLTTARHVAVITGAGTSAESGIPTFREAQSGLWARFRPEELATPEAFERQPDTVWQWYQWRRRLVAEAQPNPGHHALVELAARVPRLTLITQNVDGLHQAAGSEPVIELHGNIHRTICHRTGRTIDDDQFEPDCESPPASPHAADGLGRPGVVWFGEALPEQALAGALQAAATCDLFFSIGTSALVQPAASLALHAAQQGAAVVEINPEPTPLTPHADHVLSGNSAIVLPALIEAMDTRST